MSTVFFICLVVGAFSGLMSGLFGIGGGIIIIPALVAIFSYFSVVPSAIAMHMAVGTSLATIIVTTASSVTSHHRRGSVSWGMLKILLPGLVVGSIVGVVVAGYLPSHVLVRLFSLFLLFVGVHLLFSKQRLTVQAAPSPLSMKVVSGLIGALSGMLGVGGGVILVPYLWRCQLEMRSAVGTSAACGFAVGVVATIAYMMMGVVSVPLVPWSTGYIYWPAFLGVGLASVFFAPLGVMLAHRLPREMLRRTFAVLVLFVAVDMLIR